MDSIGGNRCNVPHTESRKRNVPSTDSRYEYPHSLLDWWEEILCDRRSTNACRHRGLHALRLLHDRLVQSDD